MFLRSLVFGAAVAALSFGGTAARADDYRRGDAIPEGYHVERSGAGETVFATGGVIFAVSYGAMLGTGAVLGLLCAGFRCDDARPILWTLVPVAGPLKLGTWLTQGSDGAQQVGILTADAFLQGAGLGIAVIGGLMYLRAPEMLVRNKTVGGSLLVEPLLAGGTTGLALGGTF